MKKPAEKDLEKYLHFEYLSEIFTWLAVIIGALLSFLPYSLFFDRKPLYILIFFVAIFSIVWFRLLPKKFSGREKNFIYYLASMVFIALVVHFTRGVESYLVFLYYLTSIATVVSMPLIQTIVIVGLAVFFILVEAFFYFGGEKFLMSLSLVALHIWGLILVVSYAHIIFREETRAFIKKEQSLIDKEKEIDRLRDEFVFIISHELRSPITAIRGYLSIIAQNKRLKKKVALVVEKMFRDSEILYNLVEDLLELSRIETGNLKFNPSAITIRKIFTQVLKEFKLPLKEKNIAIFSKVSKSLKTLADEERLRKILENLLANSIKQVEEFGKINISAQKTRDLVEFKIADNGISIPLERQKKIFEKFYSPAQKGTEIGLYLTKKLIEFQKGKIEIQPTEVKGNNVIFTLPAAS